MWHLDDEVVSVGALSRVLNILGAHAMAAVGDVVGNGIVEERRILRDDANLPAQAAQVHRADIGAVDQDKAVIRIVKPRDQADQRRLAAAVSAHQGDRLAEADFQMYVRQNRPSRLVREADITEFDGGSMLGQPRRGRIRDHTRLAIDESKDPVGCRRTGLDARVHAGKLSYRVRNGGKQEVEEKERLVVELPVRKADAEQLGFLVEHDLYPWGVVSSRAAAASNRCRRRAGAQRSKRDGWTAADPVGRPRACTGSFFRLAPAVDAGLGSFQPFWWAMRSPCLITRRSTIRAREFESSVRYRSQ